MVEHFCMEDSGAPYRDSGVDFQRAEQAVDIARRCAQKTLLPLVNQDIFSSIGGFSGAFELPAGYEQPVILSACDGVGTKLRLAHVLNYHRTIGIDLVAMSVNDILVQGGRPLAFLDYLASDRIRPDIMEPILDGIADGCVQASCALLGGETAEMPGFYPTGDYDLAGFCIGIAEKQALYPRPQHFRPGDVIVGLASSGLHSNGYSLVRKLLSGASDSSNTAHLVQQLNTTPTGLGQSLGQALLEPTRIYVEPVLSALDTLSHHIHGMVHVTGGGFYDNIPRILPKGLSAQVESSRWQLSPLFSHLQTLGALSQEAMFHTFNCGYGFLLVVSTEYAEVLIDTFQAYGAKHQLPLAPRQLGSIIETPGACEVRVV